MSKAKPSVKTGQTDDLSQKIHNVMAKKTQSLQSTLVGGKMIQKDINSLKGKKQIVAKMGAKLGVQVAVGGATATIVKAGEKIVGKEVSTGITENPTIAVGKMAGKGIMKAIKSTEKGGKVIEKGGKAIEKVGSVAKDVGEAVKVGEDTGVVLKTMTGVAFKGGEAVVLVLGKTGAFLKETLEYADPFGTIAMLAYYGYKEAKVGEMREWEQTQFLNQLLTEGYISKKNYTDAIRATGIIIKTDDTERVIADIFSLGFYNPDKARKDNSKLANFLYNTGIFNNPYKSQFSNIEDIDISVYPSKWLVLRKQISSSLKILNKLTRQKQNISVWSYPNINGKYITSGVKTKSYNGDLSPKELYLLHKFVGNVYSWNFVVYTSIVKQINDIYKVEAERKRDIATAKKIEADFSLAKKKAGCDGFLTECDMSWSASQFIPLNSLAMALSRMKAIYSVGFAVDIEWIDRIGVEKLFPNVKYPNIYKYLTNANGYKKLLDASSKAQIISSSLLADIVDLKNEIFDFSRDFSKPKSILNLMLGGGGGGGDIQTKALHLAMREYTLTYFYILPADKNILPMSVPKSALPKYSTLTNLPSKRIIYKSWSKVSGINKGLSPIIRYGMMISVLKGKNNMNAEKIGLPRFMRVR